MEAGTYFEEILYFTFGQGVLAEGIVHMFLFGCFCHCFRNVRNAGGFFSSVSVSVSLSMSPAVSSLATLINSL